MTKEIYVEENGYIATLVLNRPDKRNSLSRAMFQAISKSFTQNKASYFGGLSGRFNVSIHFTFSIRLNLKKGLPHN